MQTLIKHSSITGKIDYLMPLYRQSEDFETVRVLTGVVINGFGVREIGSRFTTERILHACNFLLAGFGHFPPTDIVLKNKLDIKMHRVLLVPRIHFYRDFVNRYYATHDYDLAINPRNYLMSKKLTGVLSKRAKDYYITDADVDKTMETFGETQFEAYEAAAILVTERTAKSDLTNLVFHLLIENKQLKESVDTLNTIATGFVDVTSDILEKVRG